MKKLGDMEILSSTCNLSTVKDGRGGIFTWVLDEAILEFNMLHFYPGKSRGNHYHPEFVEYFLIVEGSIMMITKDSETKSEISMLCSKGTCFRTPIGVPHATHAITSATCISLLTKPWDECERPIVHEDIISPDQEYLEYAKEQGFVHSAEEIRKK